MSKIDQRVHEQSKFALAVLGLCLLGACVACGFGWMAVISWIAK